MALLMTSKAKVLTGLLAAQALAFYTLPKSEYVPTLRPLDQMAERIDDWRFTVQNRPEKEIQDLLKADDALTRRYVRGRDALTLFVAFYRSQRAGATTHSPRVCLPGSGWTPSASAFVDLAIAGRSDPINVNRYVVTRGDARSVVYYWYQSPHRVVADELWAKVYLVLDSIRWRRSDTSIVRVVVEVDSRGEAYADRIAQEFAAKAYPAVKAHLPG
jgi:EpsI family protein